MRTQHETKTYSRKRKIPARKVEGCTFEKVNKRLKRSGRKRNDTCGNTTTQLEIFHGKYEIVDQLCRDFFSFSCFLLCDLRCLFGLSVYPKTQCGTLNSELERSSGRDIFCHSTALHREMVHYIRGIWKHLYSRTSMARICVLGTHMWGRRFALHPF